MRDRPPTGGSSDAATRLEDAAYRSRVDPSCFSAHLEGLAQQARDAWRLGIDAARDVVPAARPTRVVLAGVGGSAIGADIVATLAALRSETPVSVVRNYRVPPLSAETLVLLCSYSGATEETLAVFDAAIEAHAPAIAITTGGALAERARAAGVPLVAYAWDGPPRTALGYGVFLPLALLRGAGVIEAGDAEVGAAVAAIERASAAYGLGARANAAQATAAWLHDSASLPAIIGADMLEVAARRWAGEVAENAKQLAAWFALPEFDHNAIEAAARARAEDATPRFVLLDAPAVHPRNRLRVQHTAALVRAAGRAARILDAGGETPLEAILAACVLGSRTSYYLALLRGVDPLPVPVMDGLKRALPPR